MRSLSHALVVGGAGFYGSRLVEVLASEGVLATVLDKRPVDADLPATEVIQGDATELDLTAEIQARSIDVVFQLAGSGLVPQTLLRPLDDLKRNTTTTLAVLEAVRHTKRRPLVVFVSSAAVYGEGERMPMREDHPKKPVSPYGVSKLAAEHYVSLYCALYGVRSFSVRPFSLYGPGQRKLVVYDLITRTLNGETPLTVMGSPTVTRDFVYVEDAARALIILARVAPSNGEAYNIASGSPTTLAELVDTLVDACGLSTAVAFTGLVRSGDPLHWEGDTRAAEKLGVRCGTPLRQGLEQTVAWVLREQERAAPVA